MSQVLRIEGHGWRAAKSLPCHHLQPQLGIFAGSTNSQHLQSSGFNNCSMTILEDKHVYVSSGKSKCQQPKHKNNRLHYAISLGGRERPGSSPHSENYPPCIKAVQNSNGGELTFSLPFFMCLTITKIWETSLRIDYWEPNLVWNFWYVNTAKFLKAVCLSSARWTPKCHKI